MTILRDRETNRGDFIFYTDRLATLIVEKALTLVQYESKEIQTPLKLSYQGCQQKSKVRGLVIAGILGYDAELIHQTGDYRNCHLEIRWAILAGVASCDPGCSDRVVVDPI